MVAMLLEGGDSDSPLLSSTRLALALAQQLAGRAELPRVLVLTCGALALGNASSDAAHGGAWGFARVLRLEHPALRTLSTDVSRGVRLVAAPTTLTPTTETEGAWAGNVHRVARLRACTPANGVV